MGAIMRGTTPIIEAEIEDTDFPLSSVNKIEFYIRNGSTVSTYTMDDLVVDVENNTVTKYLSEAETLAFNPKFPVIMQMRCWFPDGSIVGVEKLVFDVADMEGE